MTRLRAFGPVAAVAVLLSGCTQVDVPPELFRWAEQVKAIRTSEADPETGPPLRLEVVDSRSLGLRPPDTEPGVRTEEVAALAPAARKSEPSRSAVVQLGAFRDEAAAQDAWERYRAEHALWGLRPRFERVDRPAGTLVRLKAGPLDSVEDAQALCARLGVSDPWCAKGG